MAKKKHKQPRGNQIWFLGKGDSSLGVLYTEDSQLMRRVSSWKDCIVHGTYSINGTPFAWNIGFPKRLYDRVAAVAGIA